MSLRHTLNMSIAALERIASLDPEPTSNYVPLYQISPPAANPQGDKQYHNGKGAAVDLFGMDRMDATSTLRFAVWLRATRDFIVDVVLPLLIPAMAITILGLAADNLAYVSPDRIVDTSNLYVYNLSIPDTQIYNTRMQYWPRNLDTSAFCAIAAAGAICALGGFVVGLLSIIHWRSKHRSVAISTEKHQTSHRTVVLAGLLIQVAMFAIALSILVYARDLFASESSYSLYARNPLFTKYFQPGLPPSHSPAIPQPFENDGVIRSYLDPNMRPNPLNWNCRFEFVIYGPDNAHGRVKSLFTESRAMAALFAILTGLQGVLLVVYCFAWWRVRRSDGMPWTAQKLESKECIISDMND